MSSAGLGDDAADSEGQLGFAKQPPSAVVTLRREAKHANALAVERRRPGYDVRKRMLRVNVRALRKYGICASGSWPG